MEPKAIFLLAGGPDGNAFTFMDQVRAVCRESGKPSPSVAYVGIANNDNLPFYHMISMALKKAGVGWIERAALASKKADLDRAMAVLEACDIVFMSGGDVERGMEIIDEKNLAPIFHHLYAKGKVFFGASAGSIMLAKEWITWRNPKDDSTAEIFPCLGFTPIICDTHGEDDNWADLQTLLALKPDGTLGYGITSGAALKIHQRQITAMSGPVALFKREAGQVIRLQGL